MSRRKSFNDFALEAMQNSDDDQNDVTDSIGTEVDPASEIDTSAELGVATERLSPTVLGLGALGIAGVVLSAQSNANFKAKERELTHLTKELKRMSVDAGKKAVSEGKMVAEDFHKLEKMTTDDFIAGAKFSMIPGLDNWGIFGDMKKMSKVTAEINKVKSEIDKILKEAVAANGGKDKIPAA